MSINLHLNLAEKYFNETTKSGIGVDDDDDDNDDDDDDQPICSLQLQIAAAVDDDDNDEDINTLRATKTAMHVENGATGHRCSPEHGAYVWRVCNSVMCNFRKQNLISLD